ncbi:glycosyltransferase [Methyloversatilis sp. MC4-4]|uniref:glycosyltransferase n=1 Tax=Methyloversatilis sp. MC4-4 TaxID=3132824 RepID=UPI003CF7E679
MTQRGPHIVVFSTLFPNGAQPQAGVFIRERMFRVGAELPLTVVAPVPWFPFQSLLRLIRPHFRPDVPRIEVQQGVTVLHPRFLSVPGLFKRLDGVLLALGARGTLARLKREGRLDVLDAHFAYPDGYAASLLARWLHVPFTITLRGTEARHARTPGLRERLLAALERADRVFSVSSSLADIAAGLGIARDKLQVVGNGVDTRKFHPVDRDAARRALDIPADATVLISVGGLTERKGFHRVIELLPALRHEVPELLFLIVGGASAEGDWGPQLRQQVRELGLEDCVRFLGTLPPEALKQPLSAADVFVLATRNEGWANVFLEAMACRLPVVTTDVGGNREVVCRDELGTVVPFGDAAALQTALSAALARDWDRDAILAYARDNEWDGRVAALVTAFRALGRSGAVAATDEGVRRVG